jgi:hypothetical protein
MKGFGEQCREQIAIVIICGWAALVVTSQTGQFQMPNGRHYPNEQRLNRCPLWESGHVEEQVSASYSRRAAITNVFTV